MQLHNTCTSPEGKISKLRWKSAQWTCHAHCSSIQSSGCRMPWAPLIHCATSISYHVVSVRSTDDGSCACWISSSFFPLMIFPSRRAMAQVLRGAKTPQASSSENGLNSLLLARVHVDRLDRKKLHDWDASCSVHAWQKSQELARDTTSSCTREPPPAAIRNVRIGLCYTEVYLRIRYRCTWYPAKKRSRCNVGL